MSEKAYFTFNPSESDILRKLADQLATAADSERNKANRERWRRVNDLLPERPVVMCYAMPWNELNVGEELTLRCENTYPRSLETELRRQLYMLRHMPLDMVVEPYIKCKAVVEDSGYGVDVDEFVLKTDKTSAIGAHRYNPVINTMDDVDKLHPVTLRYDESATTEVLGATNAIFGDVMEVKLVCAPEQDRSHAPWDDFVHLMGAEKVFTYIIDEPDMMLALAKRYNALAVDRIMQYEKLGIMTQNNDNSIIGSGGYGYTNDIKPAATTHTDETPAAETPAAATPSAATPAAATPAGGVKASDIWGSCKAQIFTSISPRMFEDFAIDCEMEWLNCFALTYYGCCEALDDKIHVLRKIKTLRKISISAWADPYRAAEQIHGDYVFSYKPDPALLATSALDEAAVRKELTTAVDAARQYNCPIEIILKTLSTVSYDPQKLWRWAEIAQEITESV